MTAMRRMTVDVPEEVALAIDAKVTSGAYLDQSEFVVESLETYLMGQDPEIETWLRDEVGPTYDRFMRDQTPGTPINEVFAGVKARYQARTKHS